MYSLLCKRSFHQTRRLSEQIFNADTQTFKKAISAHNKLVLVDFFADWCSPCRLLTPVLKELTKDDSVKSGSGRSLDLVTIDTDLEFELAERYNVRAMPTVIAFKDGSEADRFTGALKEPDVRKFLNKV